MADVKIAVVSTSRADYGLLKPLLIELQKTSGYKAELWVTGSHLSKEHGYTADQIDREGVSIDAKVFLHQQADDAHALATALGHGVEGFSEVIAQKKPHAIAILGDRFELWAIALAATLHRIPLIHLHGGESTVGALDDLVRHSVSKIAVFHFTSIEAYAKRIIQMGERPEHVFCVGAIGLDNTLSLEHFSREEVLRRLELLEDQPFCLLTYHPVTLDSLEDAGSQMRRVLDALVCYPHRVVITSPNSDAGGMRIKAVIDEYLEKHPDRFVFRSNLGQQLYLSSMKHADFMIGNSSSGIIEAASYRLPVINIGDRQEGRVRPDNVIDCACETLAIKASIQQVNTSDFREWIKDLVNPYGDGNTSQKIVKALSAIDFENSHKYLKKGFVDIPF